MQRKLVDSCKAPVLRNQFWSVSRVLAERRFDHLRLIFKYFARDETVFGFIVSEFNTFFKSLKKEHGVQKRLSDQCLFKLVNIQGYLRSIIGSRSNCRRLLRGQSASATRDAEISGQTRSEA